MPTFYRIVRSTTPSVADFLSAEARGLLPRNEDPETLRLHSGISVFDSLERAKRIARRRRGLGGFIAALRIPESGSFVYERTTKSEDHYMLWADAEEVRRCVVSVTAVEGAG